MKMSAAFRCPSGYTQYVIIAIIGGHVSQMAGFVHFGGGCFSTAHLHYFSLLYMGGDFVMNKSYVLSLRLPDAQHNASDHGCSS